MYKTYKGSAFRAVKLDFSETNLTLEILQVILLNYLNEWTIVLDFSSPELYISLREFFKLNFIWHL